MKCEKCGQEIMKPKTITIGETEYELEQHDNGKRLSAIKIPKGWRLIKPWEAQRLWDVNLLRDNWIYIENPLDDKIVARFYTSSNRAVLVCGRIPDCRYDGLGVIFARDLK